MTNRAAGSLLFALAIACSPPSPPRDDAERAGAGPHGLSRSMDAASGESALAYRPSDAPTDRLIARAQEAVRERREDADAWANLSALLIRRRRETSDASLTVRADDAMRAARARDPESTRVLMLEAMIAQDAHAFRAAARAAERLIARAPSDPTGHLLLGDARLELGDVDGAVESYQAAMDLRPDLRSYERGAHVRWLHGDAEGAIELLALAIDAGSPRDPESIAWCWVELARIEHARGRSEVALRAAAEAKRLVPDYVPALAVEARATAALGRTLEAIAILEGVVGRAPSSDDLRTLSEWLASAGREGEARERLAQATRLAAREGRSNEPRKDG